MRSDVLLDSSWLGADLRILLVFALVYALARLIPRSTHRISVGVALGVAIGWSWLGPRLAGAGGGPVSGTGDPLEQIAVLVLGASLLFALAAPADAIPAGSSWAAYSSGSRRRLSCGRGWRSIPTGSRLRRGHHSCCS